ncbi:MAG: hypothetical protein ACE5EM_01045 [Sphingomonadales bacterium]
MQENTSIESEHRSALLQVDWDEVQEPGCYVEQGSGDLFRIPKEALISGASPLIVKESRGASRLFQVSKDPYVTTLKARIICAQHNIDPNF